MYVSLVWGEGKVFKQISWPLASGPSSSTSGSAASRLLRSASLACGVVSLLFELPNLPSLPAASKANFTGLACRVAAARLRQLSAAAVREATLLPVQQQQQQQQQQQRHSNSNSNSNSSSSSSSSSRSFCPACPQQQQQQQQHKQQQQHQH
ncbi:hypothetical protein Emed_006280 [Eimeria media]